MKIRFVLAAGCLLAGACLAGDRTGVLLTLDGVASNWPQAGLEARVIGEKDGAIVLGEEVSFAYEAGAAGHAAIVHVNSHGEMTLAPVDAKGAARKGRTEAFATSEPLGTETVYVLFSDAPLEPLFGGKSIVELGDSRDAAAKFTAQLATLAKAQKLATKRLQYLLLAAPGTAEHTTRGIVRRVLETDEDAAPSDTGSGAAPTFPEPVEFALNSAELTRRGKMQLDIFGEAMVTPQLMGRDIVVAGHTDSTGEDAYNCVLSVRRAEAARDYLVKSFGIEPGRLLVSGRGESQPIASNDSEALRQRNRRVEFTFSRPDENLAATPSGCAG